MSNSTDRVFVFAAGQAGTYYFVQNCRMFLRLVKRVVVLAFLVAAFGAEIYSHIHGGR